MKNLNRVLIALLMSVCCYNVTLAQKRNDAKFAESLNEITIGKCSTPTSAEIEDWRKDQKRGLVLDARPFAINQSKGKLLFTGEDAQVSVIHMNPFVYSYRISVAQQELVSTALSDFLKLLLPQKLSSQLSGLQTGEVTLTPENLVGDRLKQLEERIGEFKPADCKADPDACKAYARMFKIVEEFKARVTSPPADTPLGKLNNSTIPAEYLKYSELLTNVRDEQLDTGQTCDRAQKLNEELNKDNFDQHFKVLNTAQDEISRLVSLVQDLQQMITDFNGDTVLNTEKNKIRCSGFICITQISQYAAAVNVALGDYQRKLDGLREKEQEMQKTYLFTKQLRDRKGVFARTFTIESKFELSQATITVGRTKLIKEETNTAGTPQSGTPGSGGGGTPPAAAPVANPGGGSEGEVKNQFGGPFVPDGLQAGAPSPAASANPASGGNQPAGATPLVGDINEVIQLGRPRFKLSGGLVYSPLPRRTFEKVTGFVIDAQGNPTGKGDATVVGFDQNSSRRLLPMVFLNSRLLDYAPGSLYFSFGISAKHDDNVDLEYLIGPSLSFLNDRALFTFGAYGGMTQNLVSDVRIGQEIPDSIGDAKFFRKSMTWKPGFSFSYNFSRETKRAAASGGGAASPSNDLKNEIRIGSIPFNFALGLAVTSLEQRTYDEIAGLARDRMGNLTNGQNLARIVGVTSSSNYRLTPMALLHSRLTNFGSHDFYFTTGISGKKTDNDFDVEYLLGGSVNVYRRKVFLTFGTFIGKQQVLGGNFFEGQALGKSQSVTTENRYVWKPAFVFSYDISRIIPRAN